MSELTHLDAVRQAHRITDQAAAWYIEQQEPLSERQRVEFMNWLRASPKHVAEYFAIVQMNGDMKAAAALEKLTTAELVEQTRHSNPIVMFPRMGRGVPKELPPQAAIRVRSGRLLAGLVGMAATFVLAWLGVAHWHLAQVPSQRVYAQSYTGDANGVRSLTLSDGTLIQLDHNSRIDVRFDAHYRRIAVLSGHVLFDMGKDHTRPMVVDVGGHVLQDIGTIFDVKRSTDGDTLTVISGRVRVLNAQHGASKSEGLPPLGDPVADLTAGQQVELDASGVSLARTVQPEQVTAWLPSEISFQHEAIGDVARRFNAYTSKPLVIENDRIAEKRISGVFRANNQQGFLAYLSTLPDVRIIDAGNRIRIVSASQKTDTRTGSL
ncbi:FecR family protein [Dyella caseinilytica]|uniref:FecR domain-containing protein n=1 Tax=Dyella caseinilytica TaxID=1849581 RepID=A0ABX7GSW4_9GAMM|nr:FecR domain-containing protein [Dyella caseinilytica]QRN53116.1 FecR domain-containing protein [Dyella caseinilytica]GGA11607.1 transcriptional regulator [Dyella caseinilytica]